MTNTIEKLLIFISFLLGIIVLIISPDWLRIMFISLIGLILLIYILTRIYDFIFKNNESAKSEFWKFIGFLIIASIWGFIFTYAVN